MNRQNLDTLKYNYAPRVQRVAPWLLLALGVIGAGFGLAHTPVIEQILSNAGSTPVPLPDLIPRAEPGTGNLHP